MLSATTTRRAPRIAVATLVTLLVSALIAVRHRRIDNAEQALGIGRHRASGAA